MLQSRRLAAVRLPKRRSVIASSQEVVTLPQDNDSTRRQPQEGQRFQSRRSFSSSSLVGNGIVPWNRNTAFSSRPSPSSSCLLSPHLPFGPVPSRHNVTQRRTKVFVSRHNQSLNLSADTILEYCQSHGITSHKAKTNQSHVILRECPFCTKPTNDKLSNLYKMHIKLGDGAFFCHRCGNGGSWYDFKAQLGGYAQSTTTTLAPTPATPAMTTRTPASAEHTADHVEKDLPLPPARLAGYYGSRLLDAQHAGNDTLEYLTNVRGLTRATLRHYGVGRATYNFPATNGYQSAECVTFPWIEKMLQTDDSEGFVTKRIKVRAIQEKGWQRLDPPGGGWGLFGLHTVPEDATSIILTEGEYDAMAVYQSTGLPAVSLPNGCRSLPLQVLPLLEKFDTIYLWMDQDGPGQEGAEKFAKKLGMERCQIVTIPATTCSDGKILKDANEVLLYNSEHQKDDKENNKPVMDMHDLLEQASVLGHDRILTFEDLRADVLQEWLEPEKFMGTPISSLPNFTKLIKGYRKGELTVLTGPTGSGKTTFLGQISIDLAEQDQNVLWGSFEIKNTRLLHKLLRQFARSSLPDATKGGAAATREALEALADRFQNLPLYFMSFHGGSNVDEVLDAMEYAVYVNDVQHIILDNMQFMITRDTQSRNRNSTFDKFDTQDVAIEKFRKFATEHNIHITLVVHPRKEDESMKLNISSFYGSAKATQEADTVLILQTEGRRKYIEVKKNRFDGTLGTSPLYFQPQTGRYVETETSVGASGGSSGGNHSIPPPSRGTTNSNYRGNASSSSSPRGFSTKTDAMASYSPDALPQNDASTLTFQPPSRKQQQQNDEYDDLENFWNDCLAPSDPPAPSS